MTAADPGRDTPTGSDPDAKYDRPGYEDKSFGQAVAQDEELVDRLAAEADDDEDAERRFADESAGSPALKRQQSERTRYRAGSESVEVAKADSPGEDVYGSAPGVVTNTEKPDEPTRQAADSTGMATTETDDSPSA
jgi:hypothetical protein